MLYALIRIHKRIINMLNIGVNIEDDWTWWTDSTSLKVGMLYVGIVA